MPYSITLNVIQDLNKPLSVLLPVGYNDAIINMLAEANDLALLISNPSILSAMALLSAAINNIPSIQNASRAELLPVISAIAVVQTVVATAITSVSGRLF
jgi:hypothetical protein